MRQAQYVNQEEVRKTISTLIPEGEIFEVRIIGSGKKGTISGYFQDADKLIEMFDTVDLRNMNVYITLNKVNMDCFARIQHECFKQCSTATSDPDIVGYQWLFIDLDPVRATGISSTNEELNEAKKLAKKVYLYLQGLGFEEPVKALSGNGCHLLYKISLLNTDEDHALVEKCLKVLASLFDTDKVKVDTTNHNPARVCKLHGTLAQKGSSTDTRPHRMSRIFSGYENPQTTSRIFLEKLAAELPDDPPDEKQRKQRQKQSDEFDLVDFMSRNGMTYETDSNDRCTIYKLDECPFDPSHKNGDSKIFHYHNGAIAFKCHHNSCRDYKWQDVRLKFEPDAYSYEEYDTSKYDLGWEKHNREKSEREIPYTELTDDSQMFRTAKQILDDPEPEYEYIRSGITVIDEKLRGLQKSGVSVLSGLRGAAKTTVLGQIALAAINDGHNVTVYSGELNNKKYLNWLMMQAAGKNHLHIEASGVVYDPGVKDQIAEWMGDHLRVYNNKFGNKFENIERHMRIKLREFKSDLVIIDNLMALDLSSYDKEKNEQQTSFVWSLKNLAELTNTHIIFVAHPKKTSGFLRLNDISGTGNISNIVDNAFIIHRCNRDFRNGYKETFNVEPSQDGIKNDVTNVIEIAKDREFGTQDTFVQLFFEESTKRLKNSRDEHIVYGWEPDEDFITDYPDEIPF